MSSLTSSKAANPAAAPRPDVVPGDEVFFNHPSGPLAGKVTACGAHGVHIKVGSEIHKIKWPHVLGHKKRSSQAYRIADSGEDGHIITDSSGRRRYLAVPNEAREDPLVAKAESGGTPFAGRPGLQKKVITEKTGKRNTHWVQTQKEQPKGRQKAAPNAAAAPKPGVAAQPTAPTAKLGDTVQFKAGDFRGQGKVVAAGKDGAHVRDSTGRDHQVHWHEIATKPNYAPRNEGENDKAYAKRVVDHMPPPRELPEEHDKYFHTEGAATVPMENLHSTKTDEENQQGGDNSPKRMQAAYHGVLGKRPPITVAPHPGKPGHYQVLDGNGTYTGAKKAGWKHMPVNVVHAAKYKADQLAKECCDPEAKEFADLPKKATQPVNDERELIDMAKEGLTQLQEWLNKGKGVASKLGFKSIEGKGPDDLTAEEWDAPGGMLFIAKNKTDSEKGLARACVKVAQKGGNWNTLTDIVRCTLAVDNLMDMNKTMRSLRASGMKISQVPKNKFLTPTEEGYMDINLIVTMKNGIQTEVQLNVKDMMRAKNEGHHFYEITRKIKEEKYKDQPDPKSWDQADRQAYKDAFEEQQRIYGEAYLAHIEKWYGGDESKMIKSMSRVLLIFGGQHGIS